MSTGEFHVLCAMWWVWTYMAVPSEEAVLEFLRGFDPQRWARPEGLMVYACVRRSLARKAQRVASGAR